jgi:co-chaperonin GroES (HSP10)
MGINLNKIKAEKIRAVGNRVLVTDMYFGEQTTASGLIISSDDGKERGIYPRWGRVYAKGPDNKDEYQVGQWILVEHGRWTRGMNIETATDGEIELRMVESESVLAYSDEKPEGVRIGNTTEHGGSVNIRPEDFGAR